MKKNKMTKKRKTIESCEKIDGKQEEKMVKNKNKEEIERGKFSKGMPQIRC